MSVGARAADLKNLLPVLWVARNSKDRVTQIAKYPRGSAVWHRWMCENPRWMVMRSQRIVGGTLHGKYLVMVFYRTDELAPWEVRTELTFSTRKAAIAADDRHYGRHSPKWRAAHLTHEG